MQGGVDDETPSTGRIPMSGRHGGDRDRRAELGFGAPPPTAARCRTPKWTRIEIRIDNRIDSEFRTLTSPNETWDPIERHINCLAHVINLATRKLISTYSKSPHFSSHDTTAHISDTSPGAARDPIGLVCAIAVKERSSSKRKQLFCEIQLRRSPVAAAKQMILDMKDVDTFAFEIPQEESGEKREKLEALRLKSDEWARVDLFPNLIACTEEAQHAFSSDLRSTLHLTIPALEKLHAQWKLASEEAKYSVFWPALEAAMEKVDEYYQKQRIQMHTFLRWV
ncbi:hypothetical protein DFH08DRAFT_814973 [Mycena albidolilacea]|uniref:Uncharacterized protein n=1 Tax=Mycena albidolilacea TaxID=1033008 RepID=A0AAD7EJG2_9AGAR|nr:hypothetical protein DFH08DRAFT_814973 [Mycena albidolilacea]